jgi:Helix-turn-helix domain
VDNVKLVPQSASRLWKARTSPSRWSVSAGSSSMRSEQRVTWIMPSDTLDDPRDVRISELESEVAFLRPFAPSRPPDGWLNVKRAAAMSGYSLPSIYRMRRQGLLAATKLKGRIFIDPWSIKSR